MKSFLLALGVGVLSTTTVGTVINNNITKPAQTHNVQSALETKKGVNTINFSYTVIGKAASITFSSLLAKGLIANVKTTKIITEKVNIVVQYLKNLEIINLVNHDGSLPTSFYNKVANFIITTDAFNRMDAAYKADNNLTIDLQGDLFNNWSFPPFEPLPVYSSQEMNVPDGTKGVNLVSYDAGIPSTTGKAAVLMNSASFTRLEVLNPDDIKLWLRTDFSNKALNPMSDVISDTILSGLANVIYQNKSNIINDAKTAPNGLIIYFSSILINIWTYVGTVHQIHP